MAASLIKNNKVNQKSYDLNYNLKDNDYTSDDSETSNYGFIVDSDDEEENDEEYISPNNLKRLKLTQNGGNVEELSGKNKRQLLRRPTRKPDPKVFNRNALMARENRQRKKQQMENMETQMRQIKEQNKQLKKIAKQQGTLITKLTNEKSYLRSVISNKTEILQLLKTIQPTKLPITSSAIGLMTDNEFTRNVYTPSCSPNSNNFEENSSNGTTHSDPFLSGTQIIENNFFFTDFELQTPSNNLDGWESLLNSNYKISDIPELNDENSTKCNINNEHNYFLNNNLSQNTIEPGVCLHVSSGRVSLEFCESCHTNAQNAWIEEM